ncbi:MAG: hypothetical protein M1812_007142 [Candelaria pacifica]|nr:MAG: hypothetical protein M1812_007142 [Candelaria pacifica]
MTDNINDDDSQMHSSPSDDGDDTELMFPSATDPSTPPRTTQTQNFLPTAELSPPASQDPREDLEMGNSMDTTVIGTNMSEERLARYITDKLAPSTNGSDLLLTHDNAHAAENRYSEQGKKSDEENQPGYAWKNKRAQEEFSRAMEQVVDKKWSMRDFGDPFDERDMDV